MRRREFVTLFGGAAATWPLAARAQQAERVRRIGLLTGIAGEDTHTKVRISALMQELQRLGWTEGRNVRIDIRAGEGNLANIRKYAAELVSLAPDVIVAAGATPVASLLEATHTVPIVFTIVVESHGRRVCREAVATGRQCDWLYAVRLQFERKMARIAQTGCAERDTGGRASRYLGVRWRWPVCGDTGCGAVRLAWK